MHKYLMRIFELIQSLEEKKIKAPTQSQCDVRASRLSNVRYSQCVGMGLRPHDSDHTDGTGTQGVKGSGRPQKGRKIKSEKYGGPNKYWPGSR